MLFRWSHLSEVIGLRLASGMEVVVKVRDWADRLEVTTRVHEAAFGLGLPCPAQLMRLERLGEGRALSIERYEPVGELLPRGPLLLSSSAAALAATQATLAEIALDPSLPDPLTPVRWLDWGAGLRWPQPDDVDADLNRIDPGDWIDQIGRDAARVLSAVDLPPVLGHGDFESSNVLYDQSGNLVMLHDWDSIVHLPEACVAGAAALVFPANNEPYCSEVEETGRYLEAYQSQRGIEFSDEEVRCAWAAGTWQLAFNAKKELARGGPTPLGDQLAAQADQRRAQLLD